MLLPRRLITIDTWKSPQTVVNTIRSLTEKTLTPWKQESRRLFWGSVGTETFQIGPYLEPNSRGYSTCPLLSGSVEPLAEGARIRITAELRTDTRAFLNLWFILAGIFFAILLICYLFNPSIGFLFVVVPFLMFVGGQAIIRISFKLQTDKMEKALRNVFPEKRE